MPPTLAADAKITVTGAAGTRIVATDQSGVYQIDGLASGDYTVQLEAHPLKLKRKELSSPPWLTKAFARKFGSLGDAAATKPQRGLPMTKPVTRNANRDIALLDFIS
jgi:hypothetical protein